MYKFFINDKPLLISAQACSDERFSELETVSYSGKEKCMDLVRKIEEANHKGAIIIHPDPTQVLLEIKSNFTAIHAGGGIVFNPQNELLIMKRLGKWDLPKGKIDPGETVEEGALREVEEECGIDGLKIRKYFTDTFHTYKLQGHRFLKISHWYIMDCHSQLLPTPQIEENITEVKWKAYQEINPKSLDTYESIRELLFDLKEVIH